VSSGGPPDNRHLHLLQNVPFRPYFIIGDHRSGTTLLHRLLAGTGSFNYVSAYHVMRYNEILTNHLEGRTEAAKTALANTFAQLGMKNRIIDDTPTTPDAPVEYGFILAAALNVRRALLTPAAQEKFEELCRKVQYLSDPQKPLLLKNPWDVLNFVSIKERVPSARFIFIHRHPLTVMTSQVHAIRSMLAARNPFVAMLAPWYAKLYERRLQLSAARFFDASPFDLWVRLVGLHTIRVARYFLANIGALPAADYVSLTYEELCRRPDETMERILRFAGVADAGRHRWSDSISPRATRPLPEVQRKYRRLAPRLQPFLEFHGYAIEPEAP
jgi:hypothetical protein